MSGRAPTRPERHPDMYPGDVVSPHIELSNSNWGKVYSGLLADGKTLWGSEGVYQVKVLSPLEVTNDGITFNFEDLLFRENARRAVIGDGHKVLDDEYHSDATGDDPVQGGIPVGNSTPKWDLLAAPTAHSQLLVSDTSEDQYMIWDLSPAQGDILYGHDNAGTVEWTKLPKGNDNDILTMNGNEPNWEAAGAGGAYPGAHDLLGAEHDDTTTDTVTRGSVIYGNATPAWDEFAHPGVAGASGWIGSIALAGWDADDFTDWVLSDGSHSPANAQPVGHALDVVNHVIQPYITDANIQAAAGAGLIGANNLFTLTAVAVLTFSDNQDRTGIVIDSNDWRDRAGHLEVFPALGSPGGIPDDAADLSNNLDSSGSSIDARDVENYIEGFKTDGNGDSTLIPAQLAGQSADGDQVTLKIYVDNADDGHLKADWNYIDNSGTTTTVDVAVAVWAWASTTLSSLTPIDATP